MTSKKHLISLTGIATSQKQNTRYDERCDKFEIMYGQTPENESVDSIYNMQVPDTSFKVIE